MIHAYKVINARAVPIPKPGPHKKQKRPKQKPPLERHCRKCNTDVGTCAWRHSESRIIKMETGGGIMGGKIPDDQTAWLCHVCDIELSVPLLREATQEELEEHAEQWIKLIDLSH